MEKNYALTTDLFIPLTILDNAINASYEPSKEKFLHVFIQLVDTLQDVNSKAQDYLGKTKYTNEVILDHIHQATLKLNENLIEIQDSFIRKDYMTLVDLIEYDLKDTLIRWNEIVKNL